MQIKFKTALVTGSSRGLGRQIAVKLATEGVKKIAIHYRTGRSDAETTLSLIEAAGASGVVVQGDVADVVAAENLVKEAARKLGGCDIYVQSVVPRLGEIYEHVMSTELSLAKWQLAFDTQARAFFVCAGTAAKFMRSGGRIVGLSYSVGGWADGWLAALGGHGIGEGSDGQHQPLFRGGAGAARDYGEYGEPWFFGCVDSGRTDPARVARRDAGMGGVGMDSHGPTRHAGGRRGCLCAAVQ